VPGVRHLPSFKAKCLRVARPIRRNIRPSPAKVPKHLFLSDPGAARSSQAI
jgi:hypothetical protein